MREITIERNLMSSSLTHLHLEWIYEPSNLNIILRVTFESFLKGDGLFNLTKQQVEVNHFLNKTLS